jgi:Protein of unknown function (DUF2946)
VRGSRVEHRRLIEFIGRNYAADANGAWFFQNGPQRVFVDLQAAPLVAGVQRAGHPDSTGILTSHLGHDLPTPRACWVDETGRLFLDCAGVLALMRSPDMDTAADMLLCGHWPSAQEISFAELTRQSGHQLRPRPAP